MEIKVGDVLDLLDESLSQIGGCGDGNCCIHRRGGMHTNGRCKCAWRPDNTQARKLERALRNYQIAVSEIRKRMK